MADRDRRAGDPRELSYCDKYRGRVRGRPVTASSRRYISGKGTSAAEGVRATAEDAARMFSELYDPLADAVEHPEEGTDPPVVSGDSPARMAVDAPRRTGEGTDVEESESGDSSGEEGDGDDGVPEADIPDSVPRRDPGMGKGFVLYSSRPSSSPMTRIPIEQIGVQLGRPPVVPPSDPTPAPTDRGIPTRAPPRAHSHMEAVLSRWDPS